MILHAHMEVRGLTAQALFQVALSIAQDLISSGHPRQAQAAVLERLQEAGLGAAYLRLEGGALQWEYDPAYLCPAAMKTLTQSPQAVPVPLMPMQLSTVSLLKGVLDSAQPRFVESDEWIPPDTPQDVRRSALQVAHVLEITCGILSPVIHDGRALGLLVVWGHELTRDDLPAAEQIGRLLGAALSRPAFQAATGQAATQDRDALLALQSVISTLSIDQPLEQSLRVVRDALPRLLPEMLAPVFVLRDWERNEWNWQPLIPDWAESTVRKHLGRIADRLVTRVGESGLWKTLSQGGLVCTTDSAELLGHAMPPRMARTIQKRQLSRYDGWMKPSVCSLRSENIPSRPTQAKTWICWRRWRKKAPWPSPMRNWPKSATASGNSLSACWTPSSSVLVVADPSGIITHVNQYLLQRTGWTREELIGCPWVETCIPAAWQAHVREIIRRLPDQIGGSRFSNPILTKDGRELFVEWRNSTVSDEDGRVPYLLGIGYIVGTEAAIVNREEGNVKT